MDEQRRANIPATRHRPNLQAPQSPEELLNGRSALDLDSEPAAEQWMNDYYDRRATRTLGPNGMSSLSLVSRAGLPPVIFQP